MTDQEQEIAALKARLAAIETAPKPAPGPSAASLIGRGALLVVAICCGLLIIGASQARVPDSEVTSNFVLAVVVGFVGIVCAWLAFRKPRSK